MDLLRLLMPLMVFIVFYYLIEQLVEHAIGNRRVYNVSRHNLTQYMVTYMYSLADRPAPVKHSFLYRMYERLVSVHQVYSMITSWMLLVPATTICLIGCAAAWLNRKAADDWWEKALEKEGVTAHKDDDYEYDNNTVWRIYFDAEEDQYIPDLDDDLPSWTRFYPEDEYDTCVEYTESSCSGFDDAYIPTNTRPPRSLYYNLFSESGDYAEITSSPEKNECAEKIKVPLQIRTKRKKFFKLTRLFACCRGSRT